MIGLSRKAARPVCAPWLHTGFLRVFLKCVCPCVWLPDCRLPSRPVINTPVVSAVVYSEGARLPSPLERPVLVEYTLLETEERTKPVCVFWNHSVM